MAALGRALPQRRPSAPPGHRRPDRRRGAQRWTAPGPQTRQKQAATSTGIPRNPGPLRIHRRPRHHRRRPLRRLTCTSPRPTRPAFRRPHPGATEQQIREIVAEGFQEIYFKDGGRRATASPTSTLNDIDYLDLD